MSEEQPQFKVTDRRLFNSDGTPREIAEEEAAKKDDATGAAANETSAPAPEAAATGDAGKQAGGTSSTARAESARAEDERGSESSIETDEEVDGAHDPASFVNFLMSIASNAAAALGMMEHPVTGERGVDLQLGKHWIDVLGMLEQKTQGNLSKQEERILEGLLSDLRMQFVSLSQSAPAKQRFTGRDILGGK
ncbi:MAG: DUF1844 domain-containing protein [Pyrinomonadaceae bacterium]|nr:DUF1844 domain-containing protein [Pyrinomonadaceae bacterium]